MRIHRRLGCIERIRRQTLLHRRCRSGGLPPIEARYRAVSESHAFPDPEFENVGWFSSFFSDINWYSVAWGGPAGGEVFVAVAISGFGNRVMMSSPDGITWTLRTSAADNGWYSVAWGGPAGGEVFIAVAISGFGNRVMSSPDGITWTLRTSAADNDWLSVAWGGPAGGEVFVAVAISGFGNRVMTSG
jgi:hypothetical membrane protein